MANKERAETEVTLGGKKYKLRPTFEAVCEIEDKAGAGIPALIEMFREKRIGFKQIAAIIYGGLIGTKVNLSFEEVGNLVMQEGLPALIRPCALFTVGALMPPEEEGAQGNVEPKAEV